MNDVDDESPDHDADGERDQSILDRHLLQLSEHFDCIRIFTCRVDQDGTTWTRSSGKGNWNAQYGMARAWLNVQEQQQRNQAGDES
jgi:hypothetical protein